MTAAAAAAAGPTAAPMWRGRWPRHAFFLTVLAFAALVIFAHDAQALATLWWTNTTFGHCLFIAPVVAWLVWQRRDALSRLDPVAWPLGLIAVAAAAGLWLIGQIAGVGLLRHIGLVGLLPGLVLTLLGPQVARALIFPIAYAFFLVPFGESVAAPLQGLTAAMVLKLLALVSVPATANGTLITTPAGYFAIAEACSGSKFVIAMAAFAVLVAHLCFASWRRRIAFVVMAEVVAIIANGIRAFGTIYAASLTSVETATGFDHIVFGWLFFAGVMAAVLAIGWRWFDRHPDAPAVDAAKLGAAPKKTIDALVGAALALAIMVGAPAAAKLIDARADPLPRHIDLPLLPGWQRVALSARAPWGPHFPNADHFLIGRYANAAGDQVDVAVAVYGSQREGKELVGFGIGALAENDRWVKVSDIPSIAGAATMRITAPGPVERIVATWYRVGDTLTASDKRVKIETLRSKLLGGRQRAVAVLLSAEALPGHDPAQAIARFLQALGPVDRFADREAGSGG
ncbi:exosortase A [Sphingomonas sp. GlSt437]|uniref:exosortase A n=1 Tax=Sphingomonas sp. GlSt437 TaxID=3389970 RepID=UPI003A8A9338